MDGIDASFGCSLTQSCSYSSRGGPEKGSCSLWVSTQYQLHQVTQDRTRAGWKLRYLAQSSARYSLMVISASLSPELLI
ncbi:hypothetical protein PsYK624_043590 [Phanerochaete sordida]|uniref:Uncharacterized protein n=1 Tax=Phanerochaete sordida TaxID=48140 RepID=A0A9P3G4U6_9APHY|nr:hypothetical protein PsYK624_043590 [Phanerochaete sordida]